MKLTDEQWEDIGSKLTPGISEEDIKKILSDSAYDYDDEDIKDILVGVSLDETSDDPDESLIIGGTDIFKEPFTEEQLAILRKDDAYNKFSTDEFNALQATDKAKAKTAHDAKLKRARELLEGNDESSDKPHDEELAGEKTPEEDFMERAAAGEVPATSGVLAGDLTPEEIKMIQMMRAGKQPPKSTELAGETTPEEKEMLNITNRLAKNLSKHHW